MAAVQQYSSYAVALYAFKTHRCVDQKKKKKKFPGSVESL